MTTNIDCTTTTKSRDPVTPHTQTFPVSLVERILPVLNLTDEELLSPQRPLKYFRYRNRNRTINEKGNGMKLIATSEGNEPIA